jgi:hypothetical protein
MNKLEFSIFTRRNNELYVNRNYLKNGNQLTKEKNELIPCFDVLQMYQSKVGNETLVDAVNTHYNTLLQLAVKNKQSAESYMIAYHEAFGVKPKVSAKNFDITMYTNPLNKPGLVKHYFKEFLPTLIVPVVNKVFPVSHIPTEPCLTYFDLSITDKSHSSKHPIFDSHFSQMNEEGREKFLVWFNDLHRSSRIKSLLYLYDEKGSSGKSLILRVLEQYLNKHNNNQYTKKKLVDQKNSDKFAMANADKAAYIVIEENKYPDLMEYPGLKAILGLDTAVVERKGVDSVQEYITAGVVVTSNDCKIYSNGDSHLADRIMMVEYNKAQDITGLEHLFKQKMSANGRMVTTYQDDVQESDVYDLLLKELPYLLQTSMAIYEKHVGGVSKGLSISQVRGFEPYRYDDESSYIHSFLEEYFVMDKSYDTQNLKASSYTDNQLQTFVTQGEFSAAVAHFEMVNHCPKKLQNHRDLILKLRNKKIDDSRRKKIGLKSGRILLGLSFNAFYRSTNAGSLGSGVVSIEHNPHGWNKDGTIVVQQNESQITKEYNL